MADRLAPPRYQSRADTGPSLGGSFKNLEILSFMRAKFSAAGFWVEEEYIWASFEGTKL